jgi:hypothetical protein
LLTPLSRTVRLHAAGVVTLRQLWRLGLTTCSAKLSNWTTLWAAQHALWTLCRGQRHAARLGHAVDDVQSELALVSRSR